jgi:hypothetical protein
VREACPRDGEVLEEAPPQPLLRIMNNKLFIITAAALAIAGA